MLKGYSDRKGFLLGEHLSHSFSPTIHAMLGDYSYSIKEVAPKDLRDYLLSGEFDFLNVTIPYKKDVIPYLTELSDEAKRIGAVNTIKRTSDGSLKGNNTDYYGFELLLKKSGIDVKNKKALVLGSGGASMPVKAVLEANGAKDIITISRSGENNYNNISEHSDADVIINTTPVGMYPNNGQAPLLLDDFANLSGVVDIIYNPAYTKLLLDAEARGIPCIGGLYMLVAQAKKAAEIFLDKNIDDGVIDEICGSVNLKSQNIILIGMPGCGKSTVGKLVANALGREFFDSDSVFLDKFGKTPSEVITSEGEESFRKMETEIIAQLGMKSGVVISTGGGVVTREENYALLHQNGIIFFIDRDIKNLSTKNRPLSSSVGVEALYKARLPLYKRFADHVIVSNEVKSNTVDKIINIMLKGE